MTAMRGTWDQADDWHRLYQLYAPTLRAVIASRVPSNDVEDVLQEAFAKAFRERATFDMERPILPLLVVIAKRTATDTWRQNNRSLPTADLPSATVSDPSEVWEARHRVRVITSTFAALNPRHQQLLYQRDIEGVRCTELAEAEGISPNAMAAVLKRARQRFRSVYTVMSEGAGAFVVASFRKWATRRRFVFWVPSPELFAAGTLLACAAALGVTGNAPSPRLQVTATAGNVQASTLPADPALKARPIPWDPAGTATSIAAPHPLAPSSDSARAPRAGPGNADVDIHSGGSTVTIANAVETPGGLGAEGRNEVIVDCRGGTWGKACEALLLVPGTRRSD